MISIIIKVFAILLAAIVIAKTYLDYRKKHESLIMFMFWTITWLVIVVVAIHPKIVDVVVSVTRGKQIGIGTFLGLFSVFLFFVTYRVYNKANRLEQQLKELIIKLGLKDLEKKG